MRYPRTASLLIAATLAVGIGLPSNAIAEKPAPPTTARELKASIGAHPSKLAAAIVGNDIFRLVVEQTEGLGVGSFTVLTGPKHPAGEGRNVLFGNGTPGTSYMVLRHFDREWRPGETFLTDWVQGSLQTHPTEEPLDRLLDKVEPIGTSGYRITWRGGYFKLTQEIVVHGTTAADSSVEVTTRIDPEGDDDTFQLQYLWDVALGADDGPVLQPQTASSTYRPFAPVSTTEQLLPTATDSVALADNDQNGAPPSLAIGVTGSGPGWVTPTPTAPESVKYVCWPEAIYAKYGGYDPDDGFDISTPSSGCTNSDGKNDSAVLLNWSAEATAGQPITFSASLFSAPRQPHAAVVDVAGPRAAKPAFEATLTDSATGRAVVGRKLAFSIGTGSNVTCTAVTDAAGEASCGDIGDGLAAILAGGYTARFGGDAIWAGTSGHS